MAEALRELSSKPRAIATRETLERAAFAISAHTPLKRGVNEKV
jgi:hypothetical protein